MKVKRVMTSMANLSPLMLALLDENIDITLTVTGNSMRPLLMHERDCVILTKCYKHNLKKGDIPLYRRNNGSFILHRIIEVNKNSYNLCGDNQFAIEKELPMENVIAVVRAFERNGKTYHCNNLFYKVYWHFRVFTIPFRRISYKVWNKIRSMH